MLVNRFRVREQLENLVRRIVAGRGVAFVGAAFSCFYNVFDYIVGMNPSGKKIVDFISEL